MENRRFTDKLFAAGLSLLSLLVLGWSAIVWSSTRAAEIKNAEQDQQIMYMMRSLGRIEDKLDKVLEERK